MRLERHETGRALDTLAEARNEKDNTAIGIGPGFSAARLRRVAILARPSAELSRAA